MGCGRSKQVKKVLTVNDIKYDPIFTGIIEFDQIFQLLSQTLLQAENIRNECLSSRFNLIKIAKAHRVYQPTIVEAYTLWLWGISACNQGDLDGGGCSFKFIEDQNTHTVVFKYDVGRSGDLVLNWFGYYMNDFLTSVPMARAKYPSVAERAHQLYDKLVLMIHDVNKHLDLIQTPAEKQHVLQIIPRKQVVQDINLNHTMLTQCLQDCKEFQNELDSYQQEIQQLVETYEEIQEQSDVTGMKIYERWQPHKVKIDGLGDCYKMSAKMTSIASIFWVGWKWSLEQQTEDNNHKVERAKKRPPRGNDYKHNDLTRKPKTDKLGQVEKPQYKDFPFRLRWVGIPSIDARFQEISFMLQEHHKQLQSLRSLKRIFTFKLGLWEYEDRSPTIAFKVFLTVLAHEVGNVRDKLTVQDEEPYCKGLDTIKSKVKDVEELRVYFLQYFKLASVKSRKILDEEWATFNQHVVQVQPWIRGDFLRTEEFKKSIIADQYNVMTSVAKNIYVLQQYKQIAWSIYEGGIMIQLRVVYSRYIEECQRFWISAQTIILEADSESSKVAGIKMNEAANVLLYSLKKNEEKAEARKERSQKWYEQVTNNLKKLK